MLTPRDWQTVIGVTGRFLQLGGERVSEGERGADAAADRG